MPCSYAVHKPGLVLRERGWPETAAQCGCLPMLPLPALVGLKSTSCCMTPHARLACVMTGRSVAAHALVGLQVRTDPTKYPYLVLPSKNAWLNCTHNQVAPAAGIQCLSRIASSPDVAPLATQGHVINVIVAGSDGSTDNTYCARTAAKPNPLCSTTSRGYTAAQGPWFLRAADPGWTQDSSQTNWVFLSWDSYDTAGTNTQARWNGGGATLAHELGHYFGLLHTHEGTPECLNGAQVGDAVADTPANKVVESWAAATGFVNLAGWCSDFRRGNHPPASQLGSFHSCPGVAADNLLNLMSYLPDACVMMLSPGQVTRMQWVVAKYRPKMMQACATQV